MKKVALFLIISFFFSGITIETGLSNIDFNNTKGSKILLKGSLSMPGIKSNAQPVEVYQNPQNLDVGFLANLGMINITIFNAQNSPVYQTSANGAANSHVYISTRNMSAGWYIIYISNMQGEYLQGSFMMQ